MREELLVVRNGVVRFVRGIIWVILLIMMNICSVIVNDRLVVSSLLKLF